MSLRFGASGVRFQVSDFELRILIAYRDDLHHT
jgi:hypothetical protein